MKVSIYSLQTRDADGNDELRLFTAEASRDAAAFQFLGKHAYLTEEGDAAPMTGEAVQVQFGTVADAYSAIDTDVYITREAQELEFPLAPIGITLDGGLVQSVFSHTPEHASPVFLLDYDTEGADETTLCKIPQTDAQGEMTGKTAEAVFSLYRQVERAETPAYFDALAKIFEAPDAAQADAPAESAADDPLCQCGNCDWRGPESALQPIADLHERVAPGETMPAGECPECGALCHLVDAEG